jgi:hypothetical protein
MTRLEGKASLVAFALFASTVTAAAEGVWVLWLTPITDNPRWEPSFGLKFRTLEECDRHAALMLSEFSLTYPNAVLEARCHSLTADPREAMRSPVMK